MPNVAFSRWDPFRDLLTLHEQIGQLVGSDAPGWTPPVDLYENAGGFVLTAELPGLKRADVEIQAEDSRVVIRGHRASGPVPAEIAPLIDDAGLGRVHTQAADLLDHTVTDRNDVRSPGTTRTCA